MSDTPTSSQTKSPALSQSSAVPSASSISHTPTVERPESTKPRSSRASPERLGKPHLRQPKVQKVCSSIDFIAQRQANCFEASETQSTVTNGIKNITAEDPDESIYHLPRDFKTCSNLSRQPNDVLQMHRHNRLKECSASSLSSYPDGIDVGAPNLTSHMTLSTRLRIILKNWTRSLMILDYIPGLTQTLVLCLLLQTRYSSAIPGCKGTEGAKLEIPQAIPDLVSTS